MWSHKDVFQNIQGLATGYSTASKSTAHEHTQFSVAIVSQR